VSTSTAMSDCFQPGQAKVMLGPTPLVSYFPCVVCRENIDGWPLLTDRTEANGDSKSTKERGPSLVGLLGSLCRYKRFLCSLGCSSRPGTKYFFPSPCILYFSS
jgi:hypothetical protein